MLINTNRGSYGTWAYLSFIELKNHEIMCSWEVTFLVDFDTEISLKDLQLFFSRSFEMNYQQSYIRGQGFVLDGWEVRLYRITPWLIPPCGTIVEHYV